MAEKKKAIVSVIGKDTVGIIAAVTARLAEHKVNILDISQTVLHGYFTMTMVVDTDACPIDFTELSAQLAALGSTMGLEIRIQRESIFDAMHRI